MTKPLAVIAGAGVAGLAAAWWLDKAGWRSVIIERAHSLRENGYMLGLSGLGFETARRMGLHERLEAGAFRIDENVYKDSKGRELLRLRYRDFIRDLPYLAVRRTDLVRALAEILPATATIRFGETIAGFTATEDRVDVTLSTGETIVADLVIGADGFRSSLRQKLFGPDDNCLRPLGYYFSVYDVGAPKQFDTDFVSYAEPGHLAEYYALHDGRLAAMHVWRETRPGLEQRQDRIDLLQTVSVNSHPQVRQLLEQTRREDSPVLIDSLTMIDLPKWSKGRVLLIGDAAHCLTLVSGQGAGMALASAEMLGEALRQAGDIGTALAHHERLLRPIITRLQSRSRKMAAVFIPENAFAFKLRNLVMRYMPRSWLGRYFSNAIRAEITLAANVGPGGKPAADR
ncbi:FAD-dependent monooxygenase [Neorhizobium alkalisoli]|uniref:2-polyprenyl-6-methoxyphenol hydroxylase-like FAD-dependent oxidoreductase n=1 Tax=Neorhizobium alkalisoli TaxID=528178 RepID=A0A561Q830_9HYPH|nr:FAD-dependent monooxygenase [Neorhizobium alkalisoli]TWF46515.1 2-polyprenyl-6-methoxyphenol hydroxylase-like FAD-dependent oxidoreductase [Neorhizobium alkalisoli]